MDRGFHFGFEGRGGGLVVLSLRRDGTYTVSPSEPRNESPSEPRLPGRSRSKLRSESREPRGARSESRGSSTSLAENDIVSSLEQFTVSSRLDEAYTVTRRRGEGEGCVPCVKAAENSG